MTDREIKEYIDHAIDKLISELKKSGMIKNPKNSIYSEVSEMLFNYYRNEKRINGMNDILNDIKSNPYYEIIPMYYENNQTIENIAEYFGVDVSTIVRNKKKLCLEIYMRLI